MLFKTLWAFLRRDAHIHTSYKLGFAIDLFGVFFQAATFYYVAKMFGQGASQYLAEYGGNYFAFVLIGIAFSTYQNVGLNSFSQSLRQEQFLNTLEPLLLTPVTLPQFLLGSALWDFLYATLQVGLYLGLGVLIFGLEIPDANFVGAVVVLAVTLFAFMGLGIISAAFIMRFKRGNPVTWVMATASELLGGVFFPVALLPPWLEKISPYIPMTHALSALRKTLLTGESLAGISRDLAALAVFIAVLWPLGVLFFWSALKRARADGTLGHY